MLARPMTLAEVRASFESLLSNPVPGARLPSETGLDDATGAALEAVWAASPNAPAELVAAARTTFAGMLDGTNAAAADQRRKAMFMAALSNNTSS